MTRPFLIVFHDTKTVLQKNVEETSILKYFFDKIQKVVKTAQDCPQDQQQKD